MKKIINFITVFLLICAAQITIAQVPGDVAQNFGGSSKFNGKVYAIATQADGKILVGGDFTSFDGDFGVGFNGIIRLNTDGTKDTSFNSEISLKAVYAIATQADGKILVGSGSNFIRLNVNGTKDTSFITETRIASVIKIQADGKILVGNGGKIIRLNVNGTTDTSFITGTGFNSNVLAIATQADGKILVGGNFTSYNGVTGNNRIIRLNADGTKDTSFITGIGFRGSAIKIQADGKILVGGDSNIIRLNVNGTTDTSFITRTVFNQSIKAIETQADGKILVGGDFTSFDGEFVDNGIIRLNVNGTKDSSFIIGTGFNNFVYAIATQADGKILVGGDFTSYNGETENSIISLNANGTKDTSFSKGTGFDRFVWAIATQADGKILVGGQFNSYNGVTGNNNIIRFNADGTKDNSFITGTGFDDIVNAIATQADGKILVGGQFGTYNGATGNNRIIRLNPDGTKDTTFITGTGFNDSFSDVHTIATQADGKILVGGGFTSYNGATGNNNIIRLNVNGTRDTSFITGKGINGTVYAIATQADGKILVGGQIRSYNGETGNGNIIRLNVNSTKDTTFITGTGINGTVYAIAIQDDRKILIGGDFTSYNGATGNNNIIRLNINGTKDTNFITGTGFNSTVWAIAIQDDGKILIGGDFTSYNGVNGNNRIIRLNADGTKNTSFITRTGFNDVIYAIAIQADGKILAGGDFTSYNGISNTAYLIGLHSGYSQLSTISITGPGGPAPGAGGGVDYFLTDAGGGIWTANNIVLPGGSFKFRLNADWIINWGAKSWPSGAGFQDGPNIPGIAGTYNVIFNQNTGEYSFSKSLSIDAQVVNDKIGVFPNPTRSVLNLSVNDSIILNKVTIVDITGKIVLEQTKNLSTINVEKLAKGVYILSAYAGDKKYQEKFIKE